ncbi:MAG: 4Fe-4S dicluster domain-containing protein [Clostridia bacterium]|nr:4Fe-4S dicluster domain-containing protein [Clostridia bacterium]
MILRFTGGVKPETKPRCSGKNTERIADCSAVCIKIPAGSECVPALNAGGRVLRYGPLLTLDGTPVYSPVSGVYRGIKEIEGADYAVVISDKKLEEARLYKPESRALTDLSPEDIIALIRQYGITDPRTGTPLWKTLYKLSGNCRRVVIDCTEPDRSSSVSERVCVEKALSVIGGMKVLLRAANAPKAVIAVFNGKSGDRIFRSLSEHVGRGFPAVCARIEEKYPFDDRALVRAIYLEGLEKGKTAADKGLLAVSPEAAAAVYDCIANGIPQVERYVGFYGDLRDPATLSVPNGITLHDLAEGRGVPEDAVFVSNSVINGAGIDGAVGAGVRAVIAVMPRKKPVRDCIGCGKCFDACPVRLLPTDILFGKANALVRNCVQCGACSYVCPSGIPLAAMIEKRRGKNAKETEGTK